ncbi:hypothetical protein F5X68DRAFT_255109 [Plectosphaerella plurivora]|uniref:Uncharacterized protein n=1 Tax=Plectosphaerella plurivora TaxID=936078 RepID=A0A9P8UJM0_9PEZI|nr:hypothetical protein F5X68DRAFT_255109 [Plectosphaerella plurivora]
MEDDDISGDEDAPRPHKKARYDTCEGQRKWQHINGNAPTDADTEGPATKPGLRTGAVENLSQRVAALEHMFLGQGVLWQQVFSQLNIPVPSGAALADLADLSLSFAMAATALTSAATSRHQTSPSNFSLPRGRHPLPPDDLIDALVDTYFFHMHIWIPCYTSTTFVHA